MIKIITIVGTRPEIIRLSCLIKELEKFTNHILIHTGQNYDKNLSDIFFEDLDLNVPNYYLDIKNNRMGQFIGDCLIKIETILLDEKPDAIIILGDTNSAYTAIIAARMKIPVYHLEAGNRSFDENVPEEINRRIIDHASTFNLVYTETARTNLLREGLPSRRIHLIGSPLNEVINSITYKVNQSQILKRLSLKKDNFIVVSIHREENTDSEKSCYKLINLLKVIYKHFNLRIIISFHPRLKDRFEKMQLSTEIEGINFMSPFCFSEYLALQKNAFCVISDSGSISEEAAILRFPAITIRNSLERPEALEAGVISISSFEEREILASISLARNMINYENKSSFIPQEYLINNSSSRCLNIILSTFHLYKKWLGLEEYSQYDWQ